MNEDKTIDKIVKLLALSEGTHSKEEAQSAMLKAQELLLNAGLTMDAIEGRAAPQQNKEAVNEATTIQKARMPWYWKSIAATVATNFRCYAYTHKDYACFANNFKAGNTTINLIGLKEDVKAATITIRFALITSAECFKAFKGATGRTTARDKNDYFMGFIKGLKQQFAEQVTEKGLIVVKDQLVTQAYAHMNLRKGASSSAQHGGSNNAYSSGFADGQGAKPHSYITSN